jgi:hypothetical protein
MTTVDKAHELFMSFDGRSPKQIYIDRCKELGTRVNSKLTTQLSDQVNDFFHLEELNVSGNFFGPKGTLALLPLLQCHPRLIRVNFSGAGVDDGCVLQLVEILRDHPRIREVDLSNNSEISVFSGKPISQVVQMNINLIGFSLEGTNIGTNVAAVVNRLCHKNRSQMEDYFTDHYFRMKDMFIGLDVDGSGWVNINTFISSVVFPWIQEKLKDRIAEVKPKKREDNCIDINTFMTLTYLTYKSKDDINHRIAEADALGHDGKHVTDATEKMIVVNWKALVGALREANQKCSKLTHCRIRYAKLTHEQAKEIVSEASKSAANGDIPVAELWKAVRKVLPGGSRTPYRRTSSFFFNQRTSQWALPASLVQQLQEEWGKAPRGVGAQIVLKKKFLTPLHKVNLGLLRKQFNQFSIPIDETLLTLQEIANMMNEYWEVIRTDKTLTFADIETLCNES